MWITAVFTNYGIPVSNLTPTLSAWLASDNSLVFGDDKSFMTLISDGIYKYDFSGYDDSKDYVFLADGGTKLPDSERYVFAGNDLGQVTSQADDIYSSQSVQFNSVETQAESISSEQTTQYESLTSDISAIQGYDYNHTNSISSEQTAQYTTLFNQSNSISAEISQELAIIAGLVQRNQRIKNCTYGLSGELLGAIMSIYPSATDAQNETNVLKQFSLSATYSSGNMVDYVMLEL